MRDKLTPHASVFRAWMCTHAHPRYLDSGVCIMRDCFACVIYFACVHISCEKCALVSEVWVGHARDSPMI